MNYWDTSCALKLYAAEPGSADCLRFASEVTEPLISSQILAVELAYAFLQKEIRGDLKHGGAAALCVEFEADVAAGRWMFLPAGRDVMDRAVVLARDCFHRRPPLMLRTLDGIHLASAVVAGAHRLVSTDHRMREAAVVAGLSLWPTA